MTFVILTIIFAVMALIISSQGRQIDQLYERVREIEHDMGYGNW